MSHFTVLVKIDKTIADRYGADLLDLEDDSAEVESIVTDMLKPYNEQDSEYQEFNDTTDKLSKEYNSSRLFHLDEEGEESEYVIDNHPDKVGKTPKEIWPTLKAYVEDWVGDSEHPEGSGRFGYFHNPQAKWDWWTIGGRWEGELPIKGNIKGIGKVANVARIIDLDIDYLVQHANIEAEEFFSMLANSHRKPSDDYYVTDRLHRMGLKEEDIEPLIRDGRQSFVNSYGECFSWGTYAVLDSNGWHEKGEMGWFGIDNATPDSRREWNKSFLDAFILKEAPETILVVVDCHI